MFRGPVSTTPPSVSLAAANKAILACALGGGEKTTFRRCVSLHRRGGDQILHKPSPPRGVRLRKHGGGKSTTVPSCMLMSHRLGDQRGDDDDENIPARIPRTITETPARRRVPAYATALPSGPRERRRAPASASDKGSV